MAIGERFNWDDVFLRDLTVALLDELNKRIFWFNHWADETRKIEVPFYYSLTGDDNFLIDAFIDDVPGQRIELNYDQIPRGVVTLTSWNINSQNLTNPHVQVFRTVENDVELKRMISKVRPLPLKCNYNIRIKVASEGDLFKLSQAFWNWLFQYQFFDFEHNFLRIQAFFRMPDQKNQEIARDVTMQSSIYPEQSFDLELSTYYPIFGREQEMPLSNKVDWQAHFWRYRGTGITKDANNYPQPEYKGPKLPTQRINTTDVCDDLPDKINK